MLGAIWGRVIRGGPGLQAGAKPEHANEQFERQDWLQFRELLLWYGSTYSHARQQLMCQTVLISVTRPFSRLFFICSL